MKFSLDAPTMEALHGMMGTAIAGHKATDDNDDDTLVMAVLARISLRLYQRLGKHQEKYQVQLEPYEALALRIWITDWQPEPPTPYMRSRLQNLADAAHQFTHQ